MPTRLCNHHSGCGNVATSRGRCDEHRKLYERERSRSRREDAKQRNQFYARLRWRMTARHIKNQHPICQRCDRELSVDVHHEPALHVLLERGLDPYDPQWLVALCKPCHSAITRAGG
jgi:hypothetical protein